MLKLHVELAHSPYMNPPHNNDPLSSQEVHTVPSCDKLHAVHADDVVVELCWGATVHISAAHSRSQLQGPATCTAFSLSPKGTVRTLESFKEAHGC
jgi:hypothetical protein